MTLYIHTHVHTHIYIHVCICAHTCNAHIYIYIYLYIYILDIRSSLGLFGKVDLTEKSILRLMRSTEWTELLCRKTSRGFLYGPRTFQTVCVGKVSMFSLHSEEFWGSKTKRPLSYPLDSGPVCHYLHFPLVNVWDSPLEQGAQEMTQSFLKSGHSTGGSCGVCSQVPFGVCHPSFGFLSPHAHLE